MKHDMEKIYNCALMALAIITIFTVIFSFYDSSHFVGINDDSFDAESEKNLSDKLFNRLYFTMTMLSTSDGVIIPKTREVQIISMVLQFIIILGAMTLFI
tara:strand:- start:172 stop:471 length:300 start_codon:yes stop_codon:yes gene_type:complete